MSPEELKQLTMGLVREARVAGCSGVVIALSSEAGGHQYYYVGYQGGTCLVNEALARRALDVVVESYGNTHTTTRETVKEKKDEAN